MSVPYYQDENVTVHAGDCLEVFAELPDDSVDSIVTDPPYGLDFMGKSWDRYTPGEFQNWCEQWATECLRALKPGGHIAAFGGTRTWHRLAAGIEDAGFEVRDSIAWLYGSGFPKSLDVSKAIDKVAPREGMFTKFAGHFASWMVARRLSRADFVPFFPHYKNADSVMAQVSNWRLGKNVPCVGDYQILCRDMGFADEWETLIARTEAARGVVGISAAGASNGSMIGLGTPHVMDRVFDITAPATADAKQWAGWGTALKPAFEPIVVGRKPMRGTIAANVLAHSTGALNIDACRIEAGQDYRDKCASVVGLASNRNGSAYGEWAGVREDSASDAGRWPTNVVIDETTADGIDAQSGIQRDGTAVQRNGGGQRIFNHGDGMARPDAGYGGEGGASRFFPTFRYEAKAPATERPNVNGVAHPTVKPLDLMRWLVRLVTPPGGIVLDPFAGSGTTAEACIHEHLRCITIEREPEYLPLIRARLSKPMEVGFNFGEGS